MAGRNLTYKLSADDRELISSLVAAQREAQKTDAAIGSVGAGLGNATAAGDGLLSKMTSVAGVVAGIAAGASAVVDHFAALQKNLSQIESEQRSVAASNVDLLAVTNSTNINSARYIGASYGIKHEEFDPLIQNVYSNSKITDKRGAFMAGAMALNLGASTDNVISAMGMSSQHGIDPALGLAQMTRAADISPLSTGSFGVVGAAATSYRDHVAGLAAASTLATGLMPDAQLPTALNAMRRVMSGSNEFSKKMRGIAKKSGVDWDGLTENDQLNLIYSSGVLGGGSRAEMARAGLTEEESAQAFERLIKNFDYYTTSYSDIDDTKLSELGDTYRTRFDKSTDPTVAHDLRQRKFEAIRGVDRLGTPTSTLEAETGLKTEDIIATAMSNYSPDQIDDEGNPIGLNAKANYYTLRMGMGAYSLGMGLGRRLGLVNKHMDSDPDNKGL